MRTLQSEEAATWIMETYPQGSAGSGQAIRLMRNFCWKRPDQIRLAKHYLASIPFANKKGYEVFLSFMSVSNFIKAIQVYLPMDESRISLLRYYLEPVLRNSAKSNMEIEAVEQFFKELQ